MIRSVLLIFLTFAPMPLGAETRSFGVSTAQPRMCRIQVTREGSIARRESDLGVNTRPSVHAIDRDSVSHSKTVSSLVVSSGLTASLDVDGEAIRVGCTALAQGFELDIIVTSRPALSGTAGTAKSLSTTIDVIRGQPTEIGGLVRELRQKSRTISTGGVGAQRAEESGGEKVFLLVE